MARPLGESFDCAGCGAKLMMATGPKGKRIPLETRNMHTVYRLIVDAQDPEKTRCEEQGRGYLNHFVTCPKRDQFKSKQDNPSAEPRTPDFHPDDRATDAT